MKTLSRSTSYSENLKYPRWQKKRLEVLQRDNFKCSKCGDGESTLAVHHLYYVSGRKPWQYPMWSLQSLCECCHSAKHEEQQHLPDNQMWHSEWEDMIGFIGVRHPEDFPSNWDLAVECGGLIVLWGGGLEGRNKFWHWLETEVASEIDKAAVIFTGKGEA